MWLVPTKPVVPGCFISENVALLRDLAHYCEVTNFPAAILSLDQEKAFDHVDWSFLFSTLSKMGFGDSFKWIRLLYRNPRCSVMVNGHVLSFFVPSRGMRQGCPLSPLLYVLSMEVLACNVRASPVIQGITLPGLSTPLPILSLYADDVSVIVSSDGAMEEVFYTYARYERGTGSKLNLDKCESLWLGGWRGLPDSPVPFQWTSNKIKVGTFIGNGDLEEANWCPRVDAVAKCVLAWSSRNLSYCPSPGVVHGYHASYPGLGSGQTKPYNLSVFLEGQKRPGCPCRGHPVSCGGFGIVATHLKSQALLIQWIKQSWFKKSLMIEMMLMTTREITMLPLERNGFVKETFVSNKRKYAIQFTKDHTPENFELKKRYRNIATRERRKALTAYWYKTSEEMKSKPLDFFDTFRPFLTNKTKDAKPLLVKNKQEDGIIEDPREVAETLANYCI